MVGKETTVPGGPLATLVTIVATLRVLQPAVKSRIETALKECAEQARTEVLLRRFGGKSPTPEDCREVVATDSNGEPVTRAMQLGEEMHRLALQCTQDKLSKVRPGGFSLEPRYRYDRVRRTTTYVSPAEERALKSQGRWSELRGTIVPDVVLHDGNPLHAQGIYDFKFPCSPSNYEPGWRDYPDGHPYEGESQRDVYKKILGKDPARVTPWLGIIR